MTYAEPFARGAPSLTTSVQGRSAIQSIHLGTWFQRTSLHLKEIYIFLKGRPIPHIDHRTIEDLRTSLGIKTFSFHTESEIDYLTIEHEGISVSMTEDGVILLTSFNVEDTEHSVKTLKQVYTHVVSPLLSTLFSAGAPLPKELGDVKKIHPIFLVTRSLHAKDCEHIIAQLGDSMVTSVSSSEIDLISGNFISVVNTSYSQDKQVNIITFIEAVIFMREFEDQLDRYLQLHRTIWDNVSSIRESQDLRYKDFSIIRYRMLDFLKTLSFVKARLSQMGDILQIRSLRTDKQSSTLLANLSLRRFTHLNSNQKYIQDLWTMTSDYVDSTLDLLQSLFNENTQRELNALKYITFIGVMAAFFGMNIAFPWEERWPSIYFSSFVVVGVMVLTSALFFFILRNSILNRRFPIKENATTSLSNFRSSKK